MGKKEEEVIARKERYLHTHPEYQRQEALLHQHTAGRYIGDLVYGANDGIITTFAVVAGAAGAALPASVVVILGLANILADGISMGASNFLGGKSEQDFARSQREKESWEIDHLRELEIEEIREIFTRKGFRGKELENAVKVVTSNREVWLDTMMKDELGIMEDSSDEPKKHGVATFAAFVIAGFFPLLPYLVSPGPSPFLFSILVGAAMLFVVGAARTFITTVSWFRGGLEMLLVGSAAASIAYFVGAFVQKLV
ncbi:VIT1/CCC1 transporter family protein [Candidatus Microgenomates bacterium]|nr:VIT1/CCC1 transporter family protein [Candidatus Microgenomates bacterium]